MRPQVSIPSSPPAAEPVLAFCDLLVDIARQEATRDGRPLQLSLREFAVLELLLIAQGSVVSAGELLQPVQDSDDGPSPRTVEMTVSTLQRKLGDPPVITAASGGYRIRVP